MSYPFPPELRHLVQRAMTNGGFQNEDDLLLDALFAWQDRNEDMAAIAEGISDMQAGRTYPLEDVAREISDRHGFETP